MTPLESSQVMLQVVASPTIIILMTLEVSFMLQGNSYSRGVTHDNRHLQSSYFYITGHRLRPTKMFNNPASEQAPVPDSLIVQVPVE